MDHALAVAEAIAIAGFVASFAQRAYLSRLSGTAARVATVLVALGIGLYATATKGGFAAVVDAQDPFSIGAAVLAAAGVALIASQAAFRVLVEPLRILTPLQPIEYIPPSPPAP